MAIATPIATRWGVQLMIRRRLRVAGETMKPGPVTTSSPHSAVFWSSLREGSSPTVQWFQPSGLAQDAERGQRVVGQHVVMHVSVSHLGHANHAIRGARPWSKSRRRSMPSGAGGRLCAGTKRRTGLRY